MRRAAPMLLILALAGCGEAEREAPLAPVRLTLEAPSDLATVSDDSVDVRGSVAPAGARVLVAGEEADVHGGAFVKTVSLEAGANVIDVQAAAPRRPAAMTAVRVTRIVPVEVPSLSGLSPQDAVDALQALGLEADVESSGGLLDELLPGEEGVCFTTPDAGEEVRAGATIVVAVAKSC
jgi:Glucodextranase, domain B/PASTA domain